MKKKTELEIIDWERKGNLIRLYLGKNGKQYGDDWNDAPYEHNAGKVYDEFIVAVKDITIPFEYIVLEPADEATDFNSKYCKEDFRNRKLPFLVAHHPTDMKDVKTYYFGDKVKV